MFARLTVCRKRYHIHPLIILLLCCFSICSSSRHSFLFPFFKGLTSIGETKRLQTAENRMQTDDNYLQKTVLNNHPFKNYRARDAFNRLSSLFEYNPFKNLRPKGRSLGVDSSNKVNPFLKLYAENDSPSAVRSSVLGVELKPPSAVVSTRNRTYFENLIASSKHLPDDEHPIIIKNNHGKLRNFNRLKPVTLSDLDTMGMTSRTTVGLETSNYTSTTKKLNAFSSSKENGSSEEISFKSSTLPTVFDDETDPFHSNNNSSSNSYSALAYNSSVNIVKPIKEWNNINHLAHLNNHLNHNHKNHPSDSSPFSRTTNSPMASHRLTITTNPNRQTTVSSSHRTPAHVIITKKGNYTTNNSSKYYATPSYNLEKKKPIRFSLKPFLISTNDQDKKQSSHSSIYTENDNPIKVNSYEDLDFSYSTTAMPMDNYDTNNSQLNIKHPEHPQLIVHSSQHTKHPSFTKTKPNITISSASNQRNNTKLANISKWSTKLSPFKINQLLNNHTIKTQTQAPHVNHQHFSQQQISSTTSSSEEEDHSFTQLQSQHQAGANKSPFNPFQNLITQRPTLQVTQLSGVYTKPDSDLVHSGAITVMDGDSSEQQQQQSSSLPNTSTTIMHNNLVVTYKPGRPLPSSVVNSSGEQQQIITTTPSFIPQQHMNEPISQDNMLNNKNKRPDQPKQPSTQSNTKTNYTISKLPKPPVKNKISQLNNISSSSSTNKFHHVNSNHHSSQQQVSTTNAQPPRRVGLFGQQQQQQQTIQQQDHQTHEHHHNHTISSSSIKNNSTSGHHTHRHQNGYVNAIHAPPLPSYPFSTPSPQIVQRNPLLAWLGVDSLTQLLDRSFLFRTFVVILTILLLPPLTVVAAITSIG